MFLFIFSFFSFSTFFLSFFQKPPSPSFPPPLTPNEITSSFNQSFFISLFSLLQFLPLLPLQKRFFFCFFVCFGTSHRFNSASDSPFNFSTLFLSFFLHFQKKDSRRFQAISSLLPFFTFLLLFFCEKRRKKKKSPRVIDYNWCLKEEKRKPPALTFPPFNSKSKRHLSKKPNHPPPHHCHHYLPNCFCHKIPCSFPFLFFLVFVNCGMKEREGENYKSIRGKSITIIILHTRETGKIRERG